MSDSKARQDKTSRIPVLSREAARKIVEKHGYRKAARKVVDALPYRHELGATQIAKRVDEQMSEFAQGLVKCTEAANQSAGKVDGLPHRAEQGAALREIREALEDLRVAIERNWDLAKSLLETDATEQLARLLTIEGATELLPADHRSEYLKASGNEDDYNQQQFKRSYLFVSGSRPLTRLIKGAKVAVRRAERRIPSGASLKAPLEMLLIMQLADHFEWALRQKATWTDGGPFSKFCDDVFESLGLQSAYSWEHLLKQGLKLHRKSFGVRRRHERHVGQESDGGRSQNRRPRKKHLTPSKRRKTTQNQ
jgi:hypothetical protein